MRHHSTFRAVFLAADAAVRRRKARDQEPTEGELDEEPATPADLLEIVKEWLMDMAPEDAEKLLDDIVHLRDEYGPEAGVDRAHRGVRGARRAHGAGDFLDRHVDRAHDAALPRGVRSARERFPGIARVTSLG